MLCVLIIYISGGTYTLKSTPKDRYFEKLLMAIIIYSQSFCKKSAERKSPQKFFFVFCFDVWPGARTRAYNKPTSLHLNYLLYLIMGDFLAIIFLATLV